MHKLNWLPRNHSRLRLLQEKRKKIITWEVIFDPSLLALVNELSSTLLKIGFRASNHHQPDKNGGFKKKQVEHMIVSQKNNQ